MLRRIWVFANANIFFSFEFIFYPRKGILFFNENGSSKGFGRGGVVALFKKRSLLTSGNFLFSSGSET